MRLLQPPAERATTREPGNIFKIKHKVYYMKVGSFFLESQIDSHIRRDTGRLPSLCLMRLIWVHNCVTSSDIPGSLVAQISRL